MGTSRRQAGRSVQSTPGSPLPTRAGGFLQLRTGLRSAGKSAVFGGVLLAMIEGVGILLTRVTAPPPAPGERMRSGAGLGPWERGRCRGVSGR